jgi:uncharacterized membrane protein YfcA
LWFGINPATAVGTDLLYAAITKAGGVYVHNKKRNIDWKITGYLAAGSVPASALTLLALHFSGMDTTTLNEVIKFSLGIALLLTSTMILFKGTVLRLAAKHIGDSFHKVEAKQNGWTIVTGVVLGVLVTLTSIGAGVLGTVALFFLYPLLPINRLVGTEIAHAVPLTLVAGLGHAGLGNMDWMLLGQLLLGSLPGIYLGSHLTGKLPEQLVRQAVAVMLILVGIKLVF